MKITKVASKISEINMKERETIKDGVNFSKVLNKARDSMDKSNMEKILMEIDKHGELLKNSPTLKNLIKYKKLVKMFMDEAVKSIFKKFEDRSWNHRGKHRIYVLIKKTNLKLIELTEAVINNEQENIDLVAKIDEIKGLLVDMYL